jgi:hypothetical protein
MKTKTILTSLGFALALTFTTHAVFRGDNVSDLVVELSNPQLSGNDLTYDARVLEGTPPANGGACALFIDVIGMPATPMSYAGAARRAWRR